MGLEKQGPFSIGGFHRHGRISLPGLLKLQEMQKEIISPNFSALESVKAK